MKKSDKKQENEKVKILHTIDLDTTNPANKKFKKNLTLGIFKKRRALKLAVGLAVVIFASCLYNQIVDTVYNSNPPARDPFTSGNVWENNDNDLEFDDGGNIIVDAMTEADKQIVTSQMGGLLLQDATSRGQKDLGEIQDVLSISLLPYNLREENNQDNKYFLSILFRDEKSTYALNYFTGKDFASEEESLKDYFSDFVDFLNYDCALFNCSKMDEVALSAKYALGDQVLHVGKYYAGYRENGDRYYYIPVYNQDGTATVYSTWSSPLDGYDLNPMEEFAKQASGQTSENIFQSTTYTPSESLQKIMQILYQSKTPQQSESSPQEIEP